MTTAKFPGEAAHSQYLYSTLGSNPSGVGMVQWLRFYSHFKLHGMDARHLRAERDPDVASWYAR